MDKKTLLALKRQIDVARQIFEKDRNVQTLLNYLFVRTVACEFVKTFGQMKKTRRKFNEMRNMLFEYKYILGYFKDVLGIKKYSNILYSAQVGFQKFAADKQKEVKQNDP